ncbi:hypothetical protein [Streptomyces sp. NPDC059631]|uniref:hypothetical protein n=1 Tax=unclassified Streptomyces TaxID=2593676 RepID=UPI00368B5FD9
MTAHRPPVPRDMPDQQAQADEDPWETAHTAAGPGHPRREPPADEVPTSDEEHPGPDEPPA